MVTTLEFSDLQKAWEGINEYLYLECEKIVKKGGGSYGTEWVSYNNFVRIHRAWVEPEFDFGTKLGYARQKWTTLVGNYIDFKYLDMLRNWIGHRQGKKARSYNYSFHFSNHYGAGKDCLVSLIFTKRINAAHPIVVFHLRTSEVTKRLLFDFLLVQRVIEYVYGHNDVEVHLWAPSFYITAESFVMYNNIRPIKKLLKRHKAKHEGEYQKANHEFQTKILTTFDKMLAVEDPLKINYKVHRRSVMQIQKGADGLPISGVKPLYAKDLLLNREVPEISKKDISKAQIRKATKV